MQVQQKIKDSKTSVLLVDDNDGCHEIIGKFLGKENFELFYADHSESAFSFLQENSIDIILLGIKSYDVCQQIRRDVKYSNSSIILLSSLVNSDSIVKELEHGADDFVTMPFEKDEFILRLRTVNRQRKTSQTSEVTSKQVKQIENLNLYNSVTMLPKLETFTDELQKKLHHAHASNHQTGVVIISLDNLDSIVGNFGHVIEEIVLMKFSDRLQKLVTRNGLLGQHQNKFLIFQSVTDENELQKFVHKLRQGLYQPIEADGNLVPIMSSIGVGIQQLNDDSDVLLQRCFNAVGECRRNGNNGLRYASSVISQEVVTRLNYESQLWQALSNQEFSLAYQPIFNIEACKVVALEALIRWNHPVDGLIQPSKFIELAEHIGLIKSMGQWVIDKVCQDSQYLSSQGFQDIGININVSSLQLEDDEFINYLKAKLLEFPDLKGLLEIELNENSLFILNTEQQKLLINKLSNLQSLGINISLDDFGNGHSPLSSIKDLPLDRIKISRSFTQGIDSKENNAFLKSILSVCNSLDLEIVAQCVESAEQLQLLKTAGCKNIQGYVFSKPLSLQEIIPIINNLDAS